MAAETVMWPHFVGYILRGQWLGFVSSSGLCFPESSSPISLLSFHFGDSQHFFPTQENLLIESDRSWRKGWFVFPQFNQRNVPT